MPDDLAEGMVAYLKVDSYGAEVIEQERPARGRRFKKRDWKKAGLLWGDAVFIREIDGSNAVVSAKGHRLKVPLNKLQREGIFSLWQIDCGQGDAALLRFPDGRFAAIDLGPPRRGGLIKSNNGRIALDFIKWVAFEDNNWRFEGDNKDSPFHLDWLVLTHPDEDHIGGAKEFVGKLGDLWSIGTVFHCGLGRYSGEDARAWTEDRPGFGQLGPIEGEDESVLLNTALIDGKDDIDAYAAPGDDRPWTIAGNYATILKAMAAHVGAAVGDIRRLSHRSDGAGLGLGEVAVKVLGPVEEITADGRPALRFLDDNSIDNNKDPSLTRNGQSVVLRFDYGEVRMLQTGDLNFRSHALLLQEWDPREFACHVGKACHHGSEDISWTFLKAMNPLATMFSSGDQEKYVHPRALALGLAAAFSLRARKKTGGTEADPEFAAESFAGFSEDQLFAPLVYSTELSRSMSLRQDMKAYKRTDGQGDTAEYEALGTVYFKGDGEKEKHRPHSELWLVDKLTYGLINVRTDGKRVIMAVMKEGSVPEYHIEAFTPSELSSI